MKFKEGNESGEKPYSNNISSTHNVLRSASTVKRSALLISANWKRMAGCPAYSTSLSGSLRQRGCCMMNCRVRGCDQYTSSSADIIGPGEHASSPQRDQYKLTQN